jgi:hypothetical protein
MALTGYVSGLIVQSVPTKGNMKVDRFTADGTFTPPAGVTYAVAHIRGGGGGVGHSTAAGVGGNSSVAFASGTITATGGNQQTNGDLGSSRTSSAGVANSGDRATMSGANGANFGFSIDGTDGALIVAGGAVTAGVGIAVTVGAGGTAGTGGAAGGSGYVWIEYLA